MMEPHDGHTLTHTESIGIRLYVYYSQSYAVHVFELS